MYEVLRLCTVVVKRTSSTGRYIVRVPVLGTQHFSSRVLDGTQSTYSYSVLFLWVLVQVQ
jgi:hypothetical protein